MYEDIIYLNTAKKVNNFSYKYDCRTKSWLRIPNSR